MAKIEKISSSDLAPNTDSVSTAYTGRGLVKGQMFRVLTLLPLLAWTTNAWAGTGAAVRLQLPSTEPAWDQLSGGSCTFTLGQASGVGPWVLVTPTPEGKWHLVVMDSQNQKHLATVAAPRTNKDRDKVLSLACSLTQPSKSSSIPLPAGPTQTAEASTPPSTSATTGHRGSSAPRVLKKRAEPTPTAVVQTPPPAPAPPPVVEEPALPPLLSDPTRHAIMQTTDSGEVVAGIPLQLPAGESPEDWTFASSCSFVMAPPNGNGYASIYKTDYGMWVVSVKPINGTATDQKMEVRPAPVTAEDREDLVSLACEMMGETASAQAEPAPRTRPNRR